MKLICKIVFILVIFVSCDGGNNPGGNNPNLKTFESADTPGDIVRIQISNITFDMIYSNNQDTITFPIGIDDTTTATITRKFFLGKTEITNALTAKILQWAFDNNYFSLVDGNHNYIDSLYVNYGSQRLIKLADTRCKINYSSGKFTVDDGCENLPATCISWYGAVLFCNWLTEIIDGNSLNVVYSNIDTTWTHDETIENPAKTGYRLPSSQEWEFSARYINGTNWTYGDHVSGDESGACYDDGSILHEQPLSITFGNYAWYLFNSSTEHHKVALKKSNCLGIYDMCGSVWEWCYTPISTYRVLRGGSFSGSEDYLRIGYESYAGADTDSSGHGFRVARTQ